MVSFLFQAAYYHTFSITFLLHSPLYYQDHCCFFTKLSFRSKDLQMCVESTYIFRSFEQKDNSVTMLNTEHDVLRVYSIHYITTYFTLIRAFHGSIWSHCCGFPIESTHCAFRSEVSSVQSVSTEGWPVSIMVNISTYPAPLHHYKDNPSSGN